LGLGWQKHSYLNSQRKSMELDTITNTDALTFAQSLPENSVNCIVTSPPYFGLRSYLPGKVQIRADITDEERAYLMQELKRLGINPCQENQSQR
jgi:DNA modification methylase